MRLRSLCLLTLLLFVLPAPLAFGYLDPASGSMLLQLVLGGVAGIALAVKLYWHKLLGILGVRRGKTESDVVD